MFVPPDTTARVQIPFVHVSFSHFLLAGFRVRVSAKGEAGVAVTFNPFPAVRDLSTSKAQILGIGAEPSRGSCVVATGYVFVQRV